MAKYKEDSRDHVVSMRVSDEEKITLMKMAEHTQKSISLIMREAMNLCHPNRENGFNLGQEN